jgi:hypothetical protein
MPHLVRSSAALLLLIPLAFTGAGAQQTDTGAGCWVQGDRSKLAQRPSELDSTSVKLDAGTVKVCYGRPHKRGREIMGGLVPYGEPWRLGANEATTIHVPARARIAGVTVEPGWYSLYTIPGEQEWRIVVNRTAQRWGIPINEKVRSADIGSGTVAVHQAPDVVEQLTMHFEPAGASSANLVVQWEQSGVQIPVTLLSGATGQ